jgi:hypothetical protein
MADGTEVLYQAAWLECRQAAGMKANEAFVRIGRAFAPEPPSFYVERSLVRPEPTDVEADGRVKVTLICCNNERATVEVSGEPLTFGPRIEVPSDSLE